MFAGLMFFIVAAIPLMQANLVDEDMFLYWRRSEPSECKPFTTYMINCNKCVCSAEGISYCTRMICFKEGIENKQEKNKESLIKNDEKSSLEP